MKPIIGMRMQQLKLSWQILSFFFENFIERGTLHFLNRRFHEKMSFKIFQSKSSKAGKFKRCPEELIQTHADSDKKRSSTDSDLFHHNSFAFLTPMLPKKSQIVGMSRQPFQWEFFHQKGTECRLLYKRPFFKDQKSAGKLLQCA